MCIRSYTVHSCFTQLCYINICLDCLLLLFSPLHLCLFIRASNFFGTPVHTFNFGQLVIACSFQYKSLLTYFLFLSHKQQFGLYKDQHHILISISLLKKLYASYWRSGNFNCDLEIWQMIESNTIRADCFSILTTLLHFPDNKFTTPTFIIYTQ